MGEGAEWTKWEDGKEERMGWMATRHTSRISKSPCLASPLPTSIHPLFISSSLPSLSLGRRRLIFLHFPYPLAARPIANGQWSALCFGSSLNEAPVKTSVKRQIRLRPAIMESTDTHHLRRNVSFPMWAHGLFTSRGDHYKLYLALFT